MSYLCRMCGSEIKSHNKVKSHALTNATFWRQFKVRPGEHLYAASTSGGVLMNASTRGVTEKFVLCGPCDNKLSKYEDEREKLFSREIVFSGSGGVASIDTSLNQSYIKLAFLADVLRCSLFAGENYDDIAIGSKHESKIIDMLNSDNRGCLEDYSVTLGRFNDDARFNELGLLPMKIRVDGRTLYKIIYPRLWFATVKIDSQPYPVLAERSLGAGKDALILNMGVIENEGAFKAMVKNTSFKT